MNVKDFPVSPHKIDSELRKIHNQKKCYAPLFMKSDCSKGIIKAHTISKSSNLKQIAEKKHVLGFMSNTFIDFLKNKEFKLKSIGVNDASTFYGFCAKHDNRLFESIDNKLFSFTYEEIFFIHYRSLVREISIKEKNTNKFPSLLESYAKKSKDLDENSIKEMSEILKKGSSIGYGELSIIKEEMDIYIENSQYINMKYYALVIDRIPDIVSTCILFPEIDFNNKKVFDLSDYDKIYNSLSLSTLNYPNYKGVILFSWFDNSKNNEELIQFIKSLDDIPPEEKISAVVNLIITFNENIYFSPKWWNALEKKNQETIEKTFNNSILNPDKKISDYSKFNFVSWEIKEIKTNIEGI